MNQSPLLVTNDHAQADREHADRSLPPKHYYHPISTCLAICIPAFHKDNHGRNGERLMTAPLISLCMIAKNEAEQISLALQSVLPIVDEIIVVDTGSTHAGSMAWCWQLPRLFCSRPLHGENGQTKRGTRILATRPGLTTYSWKEQPLHCGRFPNNIFECPPSSAVTVSST